MLERRAENLRTGFPVAGALLDEKLLERVAIFHIKRPFDLLGSAAGDAIRDRLERPDLFAGARVGQIKMEMLIAKLAAAVEWSYAITPNEKSTGKSRL